MNFSEALELLKQGKTISRESWQGQAEVHAKYPDEHSKMTKPYLYMTNTLGSVFPLDMSCEYLFAEDWCVVEKK